MDFLSLLTAVPSIITAFGGGTSAPYKKQQENLAQKQAEYAAALADTNNPLYKQLYGQYKNEGAQNLSKGIAEVQAQNRLATKMGRTPLLSNERGGEALFRQLMSGYQGLGTIADQQTRSALTNAAGATGSALGGYNAISPFTQNANASQLTGYQGIYDLLKGNKVTSPTVQNTQGSFSDQLMKMLEEQKQKQAGSFVQQPQVWTTS